MKARPLGWWLLCSWLILTVDATGREDPPVAHAAPSPPEVVASQPLSREIRDYEDFTGKTEAVAAVEIRPQVGGPLEQVAFRDGAVVSKGDLLFVIDPRPFQAERDKAEAELRRCEARVMRLTTALERAKQLLARGGLGQDEFERIAGDREEAEAALGIARVERERSQVNLASTRITAPIGGRIGRRLVDPGNLVKAGEPSLATIVSLDPIAASFDVDERTLLRLRRGMRPAEIHAKEESELPVMMGMADEEGFPRRGQIDFVDNQVDPRHATLRMRAVFPNPDQFLLPGLFARIRLVTSDPHKALLVPERAVATDQGRTSLYVVTDHDVVERREVRLDAQHDGLRAVPEGLTAEDWVIISGPQGLRPGMTVTPRRVSLPAQPPTSRDQPGP